MSLNAILQFIQELPSVRAFPSKRDPRSSRAVSSLFLLPHCSAVYFVIDESGLVQYVGATKSLRMRWFQHHWRYRFKRLKNARVAWIDVQPDLLRVVESQFMRKLKPPMNINMQHYPAVNGKS